MGGNGFRVFKILIFGPLGSSWNLTFIQSGKVRIFKGGRICNCKSFEKLTQRKSPFSTQDVISCVRDTEANSA